MSLFTIRVISIITVIFLIGLEVFLYRRNGTHPKIIYYLLGLWAGLNIIFIFFLWFNHINFPLNLSSLEGAILQHFRRAVAFEPIYPDPTPVYVPLAYNPLFYIVSLPFAWIFGVNLPTLRLVAILGTLGSGLILFRVVKERTESYWWGLITIGLFASAYRVMDSSLDTANVDSLLIFSVLLSSYIIDRNRSKAWNLAGVFILIASFWFKQHGALFLISGLFFLTWREGVVSSLVYWLIAIIFGPIIYIFAGNLLFGPQFHYFTWEVPRKWTELNITTIRRYIGFIIKSYPFLALSSGVLTIFILIRKKKLLNIWIFQLIAATIAGFLGALDPGSSDNVFIPLGIFFILVGILGLHQFMTGGIFSEKYRLHLLAISLSFILFLYSPFSVIISPLADHNYAELISTLKGLNGNVYAPIIGQLQNEYQFYPSAHWVALEDMIRGPGRKLQNHPNTRRILNQIIKPDNQTFILHNFPLEIDQVLGFLSEDYKLEADFGDHFKPLSILPGRYSQYTAWPRYLYRYENDQGGVN